MKTKKMKICTHSGNFYNCEWCFHAGVHNIEMCADTSSCCDHAIKTAMNDCITECVDIEVHYENN